MRQSSVLLVGLAIAGVVAPLSGLYPLFLMKCLAFALFAAAFNFFTGYVGLLSIGHAAFFGMGAYVTGHAAKIWGFPTELALATSLGAGAVLGLVIGGMAIRRQGIYFAMITLAMAQMIYFFCVQAPFTGAEDGLQRIPRGTLLGVFDLGNDMALYGVVLVLALAAVWALQRIMEAPFGHVLLAIRDNEARAISLGYDVKSYKLAAFVLSAAVAGLAGGLKALTLGLASLPDVHWTQSGAVILMCLLGGLGTPLGPIIGAILVVTLEGKLASMGAVQIGPLAIDFSTKVPIVIGLIFMCCVLLFRKGIVGEFIAAVERQSAQRRNGRPA
ncbi:MAG: branched-chain amino acid ABC transporter permease [Hyphomicrobiaceae bacterium]|nr:MAG: branched-chain amino acid ABC transporter permease [Hyphomicrobiaceae bacterium]